MKKFLSVILAAIMTVSVFAVSLIPAMAADSVNSPTATTATQKGPTIEVNGSPANSDVTYTKDNGKNSYSFNYVGGGSLLGWENNCKQLGLVEGVDYTAKQNADGSYTITLTSEKAQEYFNSNKLVVNALVDFNDNKKGPTLEVNGSPTDADITYTQDKDNDYSFTFKYTGSGSLNGWTDNLNDLGLVEGVDYTAVQNADGTFTITFISAQAKEYWDNNEVVINAVVDLSNVTTKKNDSSKAPATGMSSSVLAGGVAVACAGVAVLAATKKKFSK